MAKSSNKNAAQQEEKTIFIPAQSAQTNSKTNQANQSAPTATSAHPAQSSQGAKATGDKTIYIPAFTNRSSADKTKKNWTDRAANSVISYDQGGRVNAWQTALNVINGSSGLKNTKTKALSNQKYSDRFNSDVLNEYKARGGKTIFGMATNADLYKQIEDELTPNYAPAQTSYERAKIPQDITKEGIVANAIPAWFLATNYDVPTASIASSRTRGNALDYLQKYEDMSFGEKVLSVPGNTVANYGLDLENTELTGVNAMSGGKLGNGELGKASTIYSALNFAQNAGSGLTEQAFNSMLETSNWFEKIILQLEKTAIEQILDLTVGVATGGSGNLVMMGARVFGAGAQEAEDKGKSVGEQVLTGGIRSGIEIGTELLGGVGGSWRGTGYGDAVFDSLDKWVSTKTNKEMLGTLASAFGSEATEEMLSDVLNPLADRIFNISDGDQTFWQEVWGDGQLLYDGLLGGLAGLGGGLGTSISDASTAKYFGVDVATYKAAQRIAGNKKLREKYEQYTGEHLEEDEQTATMQIAIGLTDAASGKETSTRELENNIRNYKAPTPQNASEAPTTNASAPTSTDTATPQNSPQTPTARASAALGDMTAILNGNRVRVVGMTKMDNGQYAARIERATPQGTSQYDVTESKLTFDPETKSLLNMVRPYAYADEMLVNYDAERNGGDKSLPAYVQAFNIVADILGKQSTLTEDEARAWVQNNKGLSATLSESQFEAAFRAGRDNKDAHVQNSATRQGGTGKLIFGKDVNYDGTQYKAATADMISEAEREVLQTVAKAAGVDMFFYQSDAVDGKYQGANGFYRKGTVYLDVNAGANQTTEQSAVLLTAAHELTHYLRENNAEGYAELRDFVVTHLMQDGADIEAMAEKMIRREGIYDGSFTLDDAVEEIVADSCEMMLQNTQLPQIMAQENPSLYAKVKDWLRRFVGNLRRAFEGVEARSPEARAMMQYAGELQQLWDNALADTAAKPREKRSESGNNESKNKNSFRGYDEVTGKAIYEANFPKGTPRKAKGERILNYIQNVWSKKPITLVVKNEDGSTRKIEAQFDPTYNEAEGKVTDAAKLMGGNRHGTASEQRVTLDLADDYYDIAADSTYNYSKAESGKDKITHEGVKQWHYFINDILFQEYGKKETTPYRVTINVKERSDGQFVYSFNAEKEKESPSTRQTLHADVTHNVSDMSNARTSDDRVSQSDAKVKTKYSNRERDTEYMEAVNAGDTETAQRLVDEAAADAGYSVHAYHGTPNGTFYVFNGWSYFTESKDYADVYQGQGASVNYKKTADNPKTYDVYIDPKNVFDTRNAREADIFWNEFYQKWGNGAPLSERGLPDWTDGDDFIEFFEENGYDYDTILLDEGGTGGYGEAVNDRGISYVVKDSSQVKSAEPITYDADGNVIPLSERFNASEPDIRYSRRSSDSEMTKEQTREQQMSRAELLRELEAQKQRTEYWRKQSQLTKEKTVRKTDTHKFARELAAQLDVKDTAAIAEFEDAAQYLGDYIVQSTSETMDYDTLHSIALDAADILLNNAEVEIESGMEEVRQDVFDYIKANKLKVNETEFKDMPEGWKRQHRRIRLSPDGVPIDVAWQQWQEQYGEGAFPSDITAQSDMLFYLADIERAWRPYKGNPFAENMGEMREAVAQEIIDTMLSEEIRQTAPTAMDRAKAKADKRYSEMKQAERQRANDRIAKVLAEGKARTREAVKAERTFQLQRVERTQKTKSIEKLRDRMIKRLTDNTGKNHVPDILKEPVAQLLQSIDPTTTRTRQAGTAEYIKSLEKLQRVLENQRLHSQHNLDEDVKDATGADLYFDIPDGFAQQIQDYIEEVKHWGEFSKATTFKLEEMNLQELHDLENILKVVNGAVNRVNEMYTSNSTVSEISEGTIGYLDKMKPKTEATSGAEKFLGFTNQTPVYFFERMGETGAKIFKSFTDGWDKFSFYTEEILNFTKALYSREEVRAAERDIRTVQLHNVDNESGLTNENTVPVQMTRAQIMNLYAATVRGEQSINHILGGGIKLTNIKDEHGLNNPKNLLNDPKDILKKSKDIVQPDTYHLNMQELAQIISDNLTARDKEIVDKMIKFLSGPIAQWGNAVSQKRWGIDLFTEENYWPIGTDRNSRKVSNMDSAGNSASIYHLANMGFTKPLTPGANNPMIIGSAFDVFANHAADMAKYGSLVLPMLDAMKWINYSAITETGTETISLADGNEQTVERYSSKSVRKSMDRVYGHDAQDYFVRLMRDLNGSREGGRDAQNGLEKWSSRYKRQAVAANIRVMLLQPTSYIRAGNVLSLSGMAAGLNQFKVKQNYEEAIENSGIAKWKDLGFYDTNINASMRTQIKHDESTGDQIVDWTMKGAEMGDKWTWSMLWGASKHEVESKAKRAGETLTHDELMQRTNDLFTEVIYKTQVVDSPLTRSQLMRSDDKLNRTLTSFMAEPTLTYNVLAENVNEWQREASANGRAAANKKYGGKILRNMMVYCAGSIVSAAVESVIDAVRDDEEYMSFWDKYKEKLLGEDNFMDGNLASELNPLSKLPIVKDLVGIVSGDSSTDMSLEGFENAYSFITQLNRKIKYLLGDPDAEDIKLTDWGLAYQGLKAISQLSGIPGSTATRDVIGLWNTVFAPITGDYIHTYKQNPESNIKRAFLNGYVDEDEAMALLMDKETMGDKVYFTERAAKVKIADWTTGGVDKMYDELYTAMENDDRAAFDSAMNALTQDGMRYRYDVISNVRSTIKEWYTGDEHGATKLNKDMAEKMLVEYGGYTTHDAHTTVHQLTCKKVEGFSYTQRKELFLSGDLSYDEAVDIVQTYGKDSKGKLLYEYKDKSDARKIAEKEVREWQMALDTNIDYDNIRNAYDSGEISDAQLEQYLMKYGSMEEESAENKAYLWKWKEGAEELGSITGAQAHRYDDYIVGAGVDMSKAQYAEYIDGHLAGSFSGDLKPGSKTSYVPYSKRNKIWAYINSLPLTPEEKDAMAVVYAYDNNPDVSANSSYFDFQDAPWNN